MIFSKYFPWLTLPDPSWKDVSLALLDPSVPRMWHFSVSFAIWVVDVLFFGISYSGSPVWYAKSIVLGNMPTWPSCVLYDLNFTWIVNLVTVTKSLSLNVWGSIELMSTLLFRTKLPFCFLHALNRIRNIDKGNINETWIVWTLGFMFSTLIFDNSASILQCVNKIFSLKILL